MNHTKYIKIVFMGPPKSGKTSLISAILYGSPVTAKRPTIFCSLCKEMQDEDLCYRLNLCEMSGSREILKLLETTFLDADMLVICNAIDDLTRLRSADKYAKSCLRAGLPILLCLTKTDRRRVITTEEIEIFVLKHGICQAIECTSKDQRSVKAALEKMIMQKKHSDENDTIFSLCCY